MPLSLNNSKDIIASSNSVLKGNRTIDVLETIDAVQGFASDTYDRANIDGKLSTINTNITNKHATLSNGTAVTNSQAILSGNNIKNIVPGTGISLASDENNITVTGVDAYDRANIDGQIQTINTNVTNKQDKLFLGTSITVGQNLFNTTTSKL